MNRGVMQSSSLSPPQMMAGSPNWWNMNNMRPPSQQGSSFLVPTSSLLPHYYTPHLLLGGSVGYENEKLSLNDMQSKRMRMENWEEEQLLLLQNAKQENLLHDVRYDMFGCHENGEFQSVKHNWPTQIMMPVSSPTSTVTSLSSNNMLDFSANKSDGRHPPPLDRTSECNSKATGGLAKKARVQSSSTQIPFKVRKEKLGDRITALHQLVSPFGKTDTASVLLESIGYIRFLQNQIEALSLPYLVNKSGNVGQQKQPYVHGDRNCLFPEDPGQLLNDSSIKMKGTTLRQNSYDELPKKDLKSRGLCLVPISYTQQIGSDNAADYYSAPETTRASAS